MEPEKQLESSPPPALNDAIEKLMANPQLISMVASALGAAKPQTSAPPPQEPPPSLPAQDSPPPPSEAQAPPELGPLVATLAPLLSGVGAAKTDDPRACLLRALKPYVSPARREAIDTMIRLSFLSDVLRQIK